MKILTGIKPTGKLHLGHYFSCIKPALELQEQGHNIDVMIADLHALNTMSFTEADKFSLKIFDIVEHLGLDVRHQSKETDIYPVFLGMLTQTPKGLLERCHAYKTLEDKDQANMGLFTYPVLMAVDIYLSGCDKVLVGSDQLQHIEVARELIRKYDPEAKLPEALVYERIQVPGFDGRKMSKSYGNTLNLDATDDEIRAFCKKIITGSEAIEDKKQVAGTPLVELYELVDGSGMFGFVLSQGGYSYKDAKEKLAESMIKFFNKEIR